ncbi:MAG: HesA/MoeB/ThiF family protein [Flavobacteriaceae bacterium]|nr:HesA/MoeB/ThiF family protein [Flavobacteriaceae bacterium]
MNNIHPQLLFKRQTTLAEIGQKGQQRLLDASVVIIGCGGLGTVAAAYLAGSGIGSIHLVDFDVVDVSNLHRQVFYKTEDVGKPKVEVLGSYVNNIAPFTKISFTNHPVSKQNIFEVIGKGDVVLDCTDSLPIKYLINDACVLKEKPLVYGSLYKFDGYVASFNIKNDDEFSANLRDAFPEISQQAIPNCSEIGTLNTIVGIIGLMQANEVLKLVTGIGKLLQNELLIYNSLENSQYKMKLKSQDSCHSERIRRISTIFESENYIDASCEVQDRNLLITAEDLKKSNNYEIISVIEDVDAPLPFKATVKIPFSKFDINAIELNETHDYVVVCSKGITSYTTAQQLKEKYPNLTILSLEKGIINY